MSKGPKGPMVFAESGDSVTEAYMISIDVAHQSRLTRRTTHLLALGGTLSLVAACCLVILTRSLAGVGSALVIAGLYASVFCLVLWKLHPMMWLKLFRKAVFRESARREVQTALALTELGEDAWVFRGLFTEQGRIEHLVVAPQGIFVLRTIADADTLHVDHGELKTASRAMAPVLSSVWKGCNRLLNMMHAELREEILPRPILVSCDDKVPPMEVYEGVQIHEAGDFVESLRRIPVRYRKEKVEEIVGLIRNRYCPSV